MSALRTYKEFKVKLLINKSSGTTFNMLQKVIQFGQSGDFDSQLSNGSSKCLAT